MLEKGGGNSPKKEKTRNAAWQCGFPATLRAEMQCATLQLLCGVFATLPCCISGGVVVREREMQHGSVGFWPHCNCSVAHCNLVRRVAGNPHCHAAFLGGGLKIVTLARGGAKKRNFGTVARGGANQTKTLTAAQNDHRS